MTGPLYRWSDRLTNRLTPVRVHVKSNIMSIIEWMRLGSIFFFFYYLCWAFGLESTWTYLFTIAYNNVIRAPIFPIGLPIQLIVCKMFNFSFSISNNEKLVSHGLGMDWGWCLFDRLTVYDNNHEICVLFIYVVSFLLFSRCPFNDTLRKWHSETSSQQCITGCFCTEA